MKETQFFSYILYPYIPVFFKSKLLQKLCCLHKEKSDKLNYNDLSQEKDKI